MSASASVTGSWRRIASLTLNAAVAVLGTVGVLIGLPANGASLFQFYTQDSNIFAALACALYAGYAAAGLLGGPPVPMWVRRLKYFATCCLAVTFVVVVAVLSPMEGKDGYRIMLLSGSMLYHHLLCPVLALASFLFLEGEPPLPRKATLQALIPTLAYTAVIITLNLLRVVDGPYPFLRVNEQSVGASLFWFTVIVGGAYGLAWLIWLGNAKCAGQR
jgi:hypothetical protein